MRNLNRTLKLAAIFCLFAIILNGVVLYLDINVSKAGTFYVVWDIVSIVLTVVSAIIYFVNMKKTQDQIIANRALFMSLAILNIINNFIVWAISFWVEIAVNQKRQQKVFANIFPRDDSLQEQSNDSQAKDDETIYVDEIEISSQKDDLVLRLEELKKLKEKNLISEKEYEDLRLEAINKFLGNK